MSMNNAEILIAAKTITNGAQRSIPFENRLRNQGKIEENANRRESSHGTLFTKKEKFNLLECKTTTTIVRPELAFMYNVHMKIISTKITHKR